MICGFRLGSVCLFLVLPVLAGSQDWENDDCMLCHAGVEELPRDRPSLLVEQVPFIEGVHADMACVDCHADIVDLPHEDPISPVNCLECHEDAGADFELSVHAPVNAATLTGSQGPMRCVDCHGAHGIYASDDPRSKTFPLNAVETCRACHAHDIEPTGGISRKFFTGHAYQKSVHFRELLAGNLDSAACVDCHGHHKIIGRTHEESKTSRFNIGATCGECHSEISEIYLESVHGQSLSDGNVEAPVCVTCHASHAVLEATNPLSLTAPHQLSHALCAPCHSSPILTNHFDLERDRAATYFDTYHGRAGDLGSLEVANCASCHGVHNIFSMDNPRSTVHPVNLETTCKACHPDAGPGFVTGKIHTSAKIPTSPITRIVRILYIWLIGITLTFMILHNVLILGSHIVRKIRSQSDHPTERRFKRIHMIQHHLIAVAFIILAVTGFALAYPGSGFASLLSVMGMTETTRGNIHRVAGVFASGLFVLHLFGLFATRGGREELKALAPTAKDVSDMGKNVSHHLGAAKEAPRFDRYAYWEKLEYWALLWGMILMSATGFVLWFPEWVTAYVPKWVVNVSDVVHYYEALLATLAIVFWHLFFVVYHPRDYPLSLSMFTGKVEVDEMKEVHPLEYERRFAPKRENPTEVETKLSESSPSKNHL